MEHCPLVPQRKPAPGRTPKTTQQELFLTQPLGNAAKGMKGAAATWRWDEVVGGKKDAGSQPGCSACAGWWKQSSVKAAYAS